MKIRDVVSSLEKYLNQRIPRNAVIEEEIRFKECMSKFLEKLRRADQDSVVKCHNGECEREGIYAPDPNKDGNIDYRRARRFREGEAFPDGNDDWIQVGE